MFVKIRKNHNQCINNRKNNNELGIISRLVDKMQQYQEKKRDSCIDSRVHFKSFPELSLRQQSHGTLRATAGTFHSEQFFVHARQHIFFHQLFFDLKLILTNL